MDNKAKLAADTLRAFFENFGADSNAKLLLGVLLQGIKNEEALFLFGKSGQKRHEAGDCITDGTRCQFRINRFEGIESTPRMGTRDPEDYL